jgi:REP element-mobilizing transposase RayT
MLKDKPMQLVNLNASAKWPILRPIGKSFFITCMLKGAVPKSVIRDIEKRFLKDVQKASSIKDNQKRSKQIQYLRKRYVQKIDLLLDERTIGPHYLENPEIAVIIKDQIQKYDGHFYKLIAYTIMSNHFHMLIDTSIQLEKSSTRLGRTQKYATLDQITKLIFEETEKEISRKVGRIGPIWELKACDLMVTKGEMMKNVTKYILNNPVKKGLVARAEDYGLNFIR